MSPVKELLAALERVREKSKKIEYPCCYCDYGVNELCPRGYAWIVGSCDLRVTEQEAEDLRLKYRGLWFRKEASKGEG